MCRVWRVSNFFLQTLFPYPPGAPAWAQIQHAGDLRGTGLYGPSLAGRLLGGAFLAEVDTAMAWGVRGNTSAGYPPRKLHYYSAHYPTLLGIASALGVSLGSTLPPYGAALALELHAVQGQHYVQAVYQAGPGANFTVVQLPCADPWMCPYAEFRDLLGRTVYQRPRDFCTACRNVQSAPCESGPLFFETASDAAYASYLALGMLALGLAAGLALQPLCRWCRRRCCMRRPRYRGPDEGPACPSESRP